MLIHAELNVFITGGRIEIMSLFYRSISLRKKSYVSVREL